LPTPSSSRTPRPIPRSPTLVLGGRRPSQRRRPWGYGSWRSPGRHAGECELDFESVCSVVASVGSLFAKTAGRHESMSSRRIFARALHHPLPSSKIGGRREGRVAAAPGAPAQRKFARARKPQVQAVITPASPAQWFYGLYELSPVNQRLPPSPLRHLWSLARAWRLHGRARTTRLRRPPMCRTSTGTPTSTAFHTTFVTTRTPLVSVAERGELSHDFAKNER
jgi:hypothetical protein